MSEQINFINKVKNGAIATQKKHGVLASITIAQAILESAWGRSLLASKHHNLFGIKASNSWKGKIAKMRTAEYRNNRERYYINANFRSYDSYAASIEDHALFLVNNSRYRKHGFFNASDYKGQAQSLQAAGYATSPTYAKNLIKIIKTYKLYKYDSNVSFKVLEVQRGQEVELVQQILYKLKLISHLSGFYDMETRKGIVEYQNAHKNLNKTGVVDKTTWESLMCHKNE